MDNLTHSFAGALLAQMGLKKWSGRATATLVIAANIPDIDAVASVLGTQSLALRRGLTHGPIALALLPLLLTGLMLAWNRWRPATEPVRALPLLACAYIGTLSHPALDWLNNYGVRLLEPFRSTWFAGDTLFIIDVWVWGALIAAFAWSRWRERRGGDWRRPAWIGFAAIGLYILGNGLITGRAEAGATAMLEARGRSPELVVASPVPLAFWQRTMLWRDRVAHGRGRFDLAGGLTLEPGARPLLLDHPALRAARGRADVEAFLFWSRMPYVEERDGSVLLLDQRFASPLRAAAGRTVASYDPFTVVLSGGEKRSAD